MTFLSPLLIILTIIGLGIACEFKRFFTPEQVEGFELFIFRIAMPCYLFTATLNADFNTLFYVPFVYTYIISFLIISALVIFYFYNKRTAPEICIRILAAAYPNSAFYTVPVITLLLGDPKGAVLGFLLQVLSIQPLFILILTFMKHKEKSALSKIFSSLLMPIVFMPLLGLSFNYFQIVPFSIPTSAVEKIGSSASAIALFTFGLSMGGVKLHKEKININNVFIVGMKNFFHPVLAFILGKYIFHMEGYWLLSIILVASAPTAFVIYFIGKQFTENYQFIKKIVALSSLASMVFLTFFVLFAR